MADIAALGFEVDTSKLEQATIALRELPPAASAAERAAAKWSQSTRDAASSSEDFSRKVRKTIADLEFERQQLARSTAERARYSILRRAGVAEASAEGMAISASVKALQAQQAALNNVALSTRAAGAAAGAAGAAFKTMLASLGPIVLIMAAMQKASAAFEFASGLDESAEQIGVTAKNLQAMQFAATQSGAKLEQLDTGLTKFSMKMGEAADGSKEVIESLDKLGVKNLDVAGKLRPTEDILVDVAKAIVSIDDPARRSAAAVDFFGKSGTRLLPVLTEIAGGMDAMGKKAFDAGALIDANTIKTLDELADSMARGAQVATAMLAKGLAYVVEIAKDVDKWMQQAAQDVRKWVISVSETIGTFIGNLAVEGARGGAMFIEAFKAMPEVLGDIFSNAWSYAKSATAKGINELTGFIASSKLGRLIGLEKGTSLDETLVLTGSDGVTGRITAGEEAATGMRDAIGASNAAARQRDYSKPSGARGASSSMGDVARTSTTGARLSSIKGSGKEAEDAEKKYAKLITQLDLAVAAQDNMTAAAGRGEQAYEQMKVKLEAQQKALDIFGKTLDENDPRLKKLEERMMSIAQGKVAESFSRATTELNQQNVILEAQIRLMNESPEIIAKEISLIKARQEAEKGGKAVTEEMVEARRKAIEQNETLKNQAEEIKRANDLWMEPMKSALQSIQQTAADAFEGMLESGKFSFQELGSVFKKIITRMIAEFIALSTVRPVMSVLVNTVGGSGMAQQMGLGSGNVASGGSSSGGMFGGGGIGGMLGSPIAPQSIDDQIANWSTYGTSAQNSLNGGFLANTTWGQGLGAAAGIGMGAYQLLSGGGSTASTIGGIASMVGGAVSLIPGIGQIAGPIIGILGSVLPGLFGGTPEPPTNRAITSLNFNNGMFGESGGSYGMDAAKLGGLGASMKSLLDAAKVNLTSSPYGLQQRSFSKGEFSNATTFITGPGGAQQQWGQSSDPEMQKQALDTAAAHVSHQIMLEVGSGISDVMREGLSNFGLDNLAHAFSLEELGAAVTKLTTLDDALASFGKSTTEAQDAIDAVDAGFKELFDIAKEFGISASEVAKITTERDRQRLKATEDFSKGIDQMLLEMKDPLQAALKANEAARTKDLVNNDEFLRLVDGYEDKRTQILEYYELQRQQIVKESSEAANNAQKQAALSMLSVTASSVSTIQDLINELSPGGGLSGLDPASQLAGLRATADASMAQAMADPSNSSLIDRAVSDQRSFIDFNKSFTGGASDYQSDVKSRIGMLNNLQAGVAKTAMNQVSDTITHSYLAQILTAVQTDRAEVNNVLALIARYLANPDQAAA